jgi:metal-responsive CopG/Arc/MetJ family transcriptional regulator
MVIGRKQTLVQLSEEIVDALDREVARRGISRSALIREAIQAHLHDPIEREIDRRIVEAYERIPQGEDEDAWAQWQAQQAIREEPW